MSSQSDTERADLARERMELSELPEFELDELAEIYVNRGVYQTLARQVAQQLMAKDALATHARDELGISEITTARPVQAADIGRDVRRRCGDASVHGRCLTCGCARPVGFGRVAGVSRPSRRDRSESRRCERGPCHDPRYILGRVGNGTYRRNRQIRRYGGLRAVAMRLCASSQLFLIMSWHLRMIVDLLGRRIKPAIQSSKSVS